MMYLIAWSDADDAIGPIVILALTAIAAYWLFKMKKLPQGLLVISSVGAVLCLIEGIRLIKGSTSHQSIAGAILISVGLAVLVSMGLVLRNTEGR